MTAILSKSRRTGRKLLLLTILAFAVVLVVAVLNVLAPSIQTVAPLILVLDSGTWAALCLLVLFAEARQVHKLLVLVALALAVTLSIATQWFGFAAFLLTYFGAVLFSGSVLVFAVLRFFRRKPGPRALILPVTMVLMGAAGMVLSAWSSKPLPPIPGQLVDVSEELKYIHDTDQSDRFSGTWLIDPGRDRIRLKRVKALYQAGQITHPQINTMQHLSMSTLRAPIISDWV